jgi:hypothetical protein
VGDKIKIVGEFPDNPVITYVSDMKYQLNDGQTYTVRDISRIDHRSAPAIHAAGWNWDPRNIERVGNTVNFKKSQEVHFSCDMLDI